MKRAGNVVLRRLEWKAVCEESGEFSAGEIAD